MTKIIIKNLSVMFNTFESQNRQTLLSIMLGHQGDKREFAALKNISFQLETGDRVGLLGKNGAGKTILLKVLSRLLPPSKGSLTISGEVLPAVDMSAGLVVNATCMQNIVLRGLSFGLKGKQLNEYVDQVADFSGLNKFLSSPVSNLSAGMRSKLVVSTFNAIEPEILLMDEWIGVADKKLSEKQDGLLKNLINKTKIFIIASHRESLIKAHCNKVIIIDSGSIVFEGDVDEGFRFFNQ